MIFHNPELLLLLTLLVPYALLLRRRELGRPALPAGAPALLGGLPKTLRSRLAPLAPYLRLAVMALALVALARPQWVERQTKVRSMGMDLVLALDLSTSMLAEDLRGQGGRENRLSTAKGVLGEFLRGRSGDRIGLVAFAARPYPAAPLTLDHQWLREAIERLQAGDIEDGTALGDAIVAALNRLRERPASSRAVIVVTDGRSNAGAVSPERAAAAARALGIRVHAIGIGSHGPAFIPLETPLGTVRRQVEEDLDDAALKEVAALSGGAYFRADDREVLQKVFKEIDRLEKSPVQETLFSSYRELYPPLLLAALLLLLAELLLRHSLLRRVP